MGAGATTSHSLAFIHGTWVDCTPILRTGDGIEYDKKKDVLYAYRHSYAQCHADAGVLVEVLGELMSHRKLDTIGCDHFPHRRVLLARPSRPSRRPAAHPRTPARHNDLDDWAGAEAMPSEEVASGRRCRGAD